MRQAQTNHFYFMKKKHILPIIALLISIISCNNPKEETDSSLSVRRTELRNKIKIQLGEAYDQPIPTATKQQLERGRALFDQICAPCHGHRGDGEGVNNDALIYKPSDLSDQEQAHFFSEQARLYIIMNGIEGTAMMSWKNMLPDADLHSVYLYTRTLIKE